MSGFTEEKNRLSQEKAEQLAFEALEKDYDGYIINEQDREPFVTVKVLRSVRNKLDTGWDIYFTSTKVRPKGKEIAVYYVSDSKEVSSRSWYGY
ncbi:hypothetical protein [Alkalihalobacillus sp. AL-G]|uniref:hypothetical protein n=1 Tax=Alkalihalobacillus sp. AL-G TaxID=2926399 RepID=UPI0027298A23|nr:hypothetical protein [Alkalihalobacillus sp. AL-G]WLD92497.1 hypothetical protein MOJ78_15975 [Alkalihalobacillus sp. AL-G]